MATSLVRPFAATKRQLRHNFASRIPCVILDSGNAPGGQFSVFAADPDAIFTIRDRYWRVTGSDLASPFPTAENPLAALDRVIQSTRVKPAAACAPLPFCGGWFGFLGYDLAPLIERLPRCQPRVTILPDAWMAHFNTLVVFDEIEAKCYAIAGMDAKASLAATCDRLDRLVETIQATPDRDSHDIGQPLVANPPKSLMDRRRYVEIVSRALDYIGAGDIFQANLSQRFDAAFIGDVNQLFHRSLDISPAPFTALIRTADWAICCVSPERFFHVDSSGRIETRPIKGTRPRGASPTADRNLIESLRASPKDHAELAMIVDLERNDLGRVCEYGSVQVERHAAVESYSNVHHLVSTVVGKMRDRVTPGELLRAVFPGGSITGAPKVRAMQIIDELEPCRRGVYTGAIGYFDDGGRVDFNIAIRTAIVEGLRVHYHVGGGIVADSNPESEYEETLAKGSGLQRILLGS